MPSTRRIRLALLFACSLICCPGSVQGQSGSISAVTYPAELFPGEHFTIQWAFTSEDGHATTTGDLTSFDIEVGRCWEDGGNAAGCSCDDVDFELSLCLREEGCMDSDGSMDLVMPYDVVVTATYLVRVSLTADRATYGCGDPSAVIRRRDTSTSEGDGSSTPDTLPTLTTFAPEDSPWPGRAFTALWHYEETLGDGGAPGYFAVELFSCVAGSCEDDGCGVFLEALCPDEGCYDPGTGDYDVVVPSAVEPGNFTLYVREMSDNGPWDCAPFVVVEGPGHGHSVTAPPTSSPTTPAGHPTTEPHGSVATPMPTAASAVSPSPAPLQSGPGSPGVPPEPVPARVDCNRSAAVEFTMDEDDDLPYLVARHASGNSMDGGCVTLTMIWEWLQTEPLDVSTDILAPVDPLTEEPSADITAEPTGVWLLRCSLDIQNGLTLELKGTSAGGDCDELKISSSSSAAHRLRGYGGNLLFYETKVTSWRESSKEPHDLGASSDGEEPRSYVSCVSEMLEEGQTCSGRAKKSMGECRMDMVRSELGYLGYDATESYGITWKVRGLCLDLSNLDIFDRANVYGDITDCEIHHMWYGIYSYGHQGGVWTGNRVHDNHVYGFDPHDDSDYLTIHNNTVWDNGYHGIIASKRCDHLSVRDNWVFSNGGSGIMLHRSCDDSVVIGNMVNTSDDAGLALVETSRTIATQNVFLKGKWGVRLTLGSSDNEIYDNVFEESTVHEVYTYEGSDRDDPEVAPYTGINTRNTFKENIMIFTADVPVNVQDTEAMFINSNVFIGPGESHFKFENALETDLFDNTGLVLQSKHTIRDSCFSSRSGLEPVCED